MILGFPVRRGGTNLTLKIITQRFDIYEMSGGIFYSVQPPVCALYSVMLRFESWRSYFKYVLTVWVFDNTLSLK